jgi:hypothetical protein
MLYQLLKLMKKAFLHSVPSSMSGNMNLHLVPYCQRNSTHQQYDYDDDDNHHHNNIQYAVHVRLTLLMSPNYHTNSTTRSGSESSYDMTFPYTYKSAF